MLNNFFDPQNAFWRWVCNVPHLLALSVLWAVCSIPIVTLVPASVAMYSAIVKCMRPDIKGIYK